MRRYVGSVGNSVVYRHAVGYPYAAMRIEWRVGDVIRRLRMDAGWTLEQLSEISRVDQQTIHRLEKGITKDAKGRTLQRIAAVFGLTERQLREAIPAPTHAAVTPNVDEKLLEKPPLLARSDVASFLGDLDAGGVEDKEFARAIRSAYAQLRTRRGRHASGK